MRTWIIAAALAAVGGLAQAAPRDLAPIVLPLPAAPGKTVQPFVKAPAGRIALTHVRVIDGTGAPAVADRTVILDGARIVAVQAASGPLPSGVTVMDLSGSTVLPGIVGMHNHLFHIASPNYGPAGRGDEPLLVPQMTFSAPRLYLANGVTTMRTTGSVEPYADLNLKHAIDSGELPGPHMDVTGPYLEGASDLFIQMPHLKDAEDARRTVAFWADQGVTSFKAYMHITRAELKAAIDEAHRRGLKITGHLCSVTYGEAADLGIDDLEHGFLVNTQDDPGKAPDTCTPGTGDPTIAGMDPDGPAAAALIRHLVDRHVAITSTLPAFEPEFPATSTLFAKSLAAMSPQARESYLYVRARQLSNAKWRKANDLEIAHDMALERKFAAAGGLLLAGPDPTSTGGIVPGFGDLRGIELLVDAGFTPVEAVKIATLNGATYLGLADRIGSIAPGKDADLLVVKGDPATKVSDIEAVQLVFKDGVAYDPETLLASVKGRFGEY